MALKNNSVIRKTVARAVGGGLKKRLVNTPTQPIFTPLSRNGLLECIAKAYENMGTQMLPTMNHATRKGMPANALEREWISRGTILQPALDALQAVGMRPYDTTIGAFMRILPQFLATKNIRGVVVFSHESQVEARRLAGRFRRLKRT